MYYGEKYMERPRFEQGTKPEAREVKLSHTEAPADACYDFTDKYRRSHEVKTWKSGDRVYLRAYEQGAEQLSERFDDDQSGYAEATLERNPSSGQVERMKINDIHTTERHRDSGLDSQMLETLEGEARSAGCREIYGSLSFKPEHEQALRHLYESNSYSYRPGPYGRLEVYKHL